MAEMKFMGRPATVVIEVDMGKGRTMRVPIGDLSRYVPHGPDNVYGELTIPVQDPLFKRLRGAIHAGYEAAGP